MNSADDPSSANPASANLTSPSPPPPSSPPSPSSQSSSSSPTLVTASFGLRRLVESLPALQALAASGRSLALMVPEELGPLASLLPGVVATPEISHSEQGSLEAILRVGCDEAVILDGSLDSAWLAHRAGIERRWGYGGWLRRWLLSDPVPVPPRAVRGSAERYGSLLGAMGVTPPREWIPRLTLPTDALQHADHYLERARVDADGGPLIGLAPTSDEVTAPRWAWRGFVDLARSLRKAHPAVRQVLIGRSDDLWPVVRIHEETLRHYPVIGPDLPLPHLAAVLSRLDLLVSPHSGILHLAAALGVPTVSLLPRAAAQPPGPRHTPLHGQSASGVLQLGINFLGKNPLLGIEVEAVQAACEEALGLKR